MITKRWSWPVAEPFGNPRLGPGLIVAAWRGFTIIFVKLTEHKPKRAAQYGLSHYTWLCINPKEVEDIVLADEVLAIIPEFLPRSNVLGIGEIGLNKNSRNELTVLEKHIDLAARHDQSILVHTPHLEDKYKGTRLIIAALKADSRIDPERVIIDHVEEHTIKPVLDAGFGAGITLYPESKCTSPRAIDMIDVYGSDKIWMNCACDWGRSDPLAVPKAAVEMRKRGYDERAVERFYFKTPRNSWGSVRHSNALRETFF